APTAAWTSPSAACRPKRPFEPAPSRAPVAGADRTTRRRIVDAGRAVRYTWGMRRFGLLAAGLLASVVAGCGPPADEGFTSIHVSELVAMGNSNDGAATVLDANG